MDIFFWYCLENCRSLKETGALEEAAREEDDKDWEALDEDRTVGEEALEETIGIVAAVEERTEDGEALDEDEHVGEDVIEEATGIAAAVEDPAEDGEDLEEDEYFGKKRSMSRALRPRL